MHGDLRVRHWRDPYIWKEGDVWLAVIGGQLLSPRRGVALLYGSRDLTRWKYLHPLCEGSKKTGRVWECPIFFRAGGTHVLVISPVGRQTMYATGAYARRRFLPGKWRVLDFGKKFYAPNVVLDKQGRPTLIGWVRKGGTGGWSGCFSLPRVVSLAANNTLSSQPLPALKKLRKSRKSLENQVIFPTATNKPKPISKCSEVRAVFQGKFPGLFGLKIAELPGGRETKIWMEPGKQKFGVGKSEGTYAPQDDLSMLQLFIDRSVMEIFLNGSCLTTRFYPEPDKAIAIAPYAVGRPVNLKKIEIWDLKSIWK